MKLSHIMTPLVKLLMPQQASHYVTKPLLTLVIYLLFYLLVDYLGNGYSTINGIYEILLVAAVQAPFMAIALAIVGYLDRTQRKLAQLATTDVLTGLPNRRDFMEVAEKSVLGMTPGFLLILDADYFKRINDTYGHAVGDICLAAISERLKRLQRPNDVIGRIGGEEFAAFISDRSQDDITALGRKLTYQYTIDAPQLKKPIHFTMSVGAAEARRDDTLIGLMRRADEALYDAKLAGRGRLVIWRKQNTADQAMRAG